MTRKIIEFSIFLLVSLYGESYFAYDGSNEPSCNGDSSGTVDERWSTPEECLRTCTENEAPRYCYYHFNLEYYPTMNAACTLCRPNNTNQLSNIGECECIEADGYERTVLSINRMLPGPSIQVCLNDMVIVDIANNMEGIDVSLHWHGVFQNGYQYYDGVPYVTQCPIHARDTFRYQFRVKNAGTHFWHSHVGVHKIDGQYGSLIVRQPSKIDPQKRHYDEDLPTHVLLLSDWMHELSMERLPGLLRRLKGHDPENILINGKGTWQDEAKWYKSNVAYCFLLILAHTRSFLYEEVNIESALIIEENDPATNKTTNTSIEILDVEPGKRYRIRMINSFSTVCLSQLNIEDHTVRVIAQDGEDVEPVPVDSIITASGERVDFVLTADQPANRAYWIQVRGLGECATTMVQQLGLLRYTGSASTLPPTERPTYENGLRQGITYNPLGTQCDDEKSSICVNQFKRVRNDDENFLAVEADYQFVIPFNFHDYSKELKSFFKPGNYRSFLTSNAATLLTGVVNDISYQPASQPLISQPNVKNQRCNASINLLKDIDRPAECAHTVDVKKGSLVEFIIYDEAPLPDLDHPFHLHGYAFRLFDIGHFTDNRNITHADIAPILEEHRQKLIEGSYHRMPGKDTVIVPHGGWVILRIKADNPGWWMFHCHFTWHTALGMVFIVHVGEQSDLPPVPPGFPRCGDFTPPVCPYE